MPRWPLVAVVVTVSMTRRLLVESLGTGVVEDDLADSVYGFCIEEAVLRNDDCEFGLLFSLRCSLMRLMKLSRGRRGAESMKLKDESRLLFGLSWILDVNFSQ